MLLLNRLTIRGLLALVGLVILAWFGADLTGAQQLTLGAIMAAAGVTDLAAEWPTTHTARRNRRLGRAAGLLVVGAVLVAGLTHPSSQAGGRVLAAGLLVVGGVDVVAGVVQRRSSQASWMLASGLTSIAAGAMMMTWPAGTVLAVLVGIALAWVAAAALDLWATVRRYKTRSNLERWTARTALATWLRSRELTPAACARLVEKLTYERGDVTRFFVLVVLSTIIATLGVLTDSTAVVVGAMLIAPLMTPIMGLAQALVAGHPTDAARAAVLVVGGVATAVLVSATLAHVLPGFEGIDTNDQITSRVSPTVLDLLIAVAAGVAGAFALAREDVRDSLPGVAIAVALVPPLSVVGITLQAGAYDDAAGAMLLFLTNLVAMLLAGGLTFIAAGVVPIDQLNRERRRVRVYAATVLCGALVIAGPLIGTSKDLLTAATAHSAAESAAEDWVARRDGAQLVNIDVLGGTVVVTASGPGDPPPSEPLLEGLTGALGRDVKLDFRWVYESREVVSSSSD